MVVGGDGDEPDPFGGGDLAVEDSISTTLATLSLIEEEDQAIGGGMYLGPNQRMGESAE